MVHNRIPQSAHGGPPDTSAGSAALRRALSANAHLIAFAAVVSVFVNALTLTGPLYMLQVYDRVLASRSEETLAALSILAVFLFATMGLLDWTRTRVMARVGARFQDRLDPRVFGAVLARAADADRDGRAAGGLADLEAIRRFMGSPVFFALFDLPFTPLFVALIFVFHPLLGWAAVGGGGVLVAMALANQLLTRRSQAAAARAAGRADALAGSMRLGAEAVVGMGMHDAVRARWQAHRDRALAHGVRAAERTGLFATATRAFRLVLQSAMLGLGAWLVLQDRMTPGAMIAGAILLTRALAPTEAVLSNWALVQAAIAGWRNLARALALAPEPVARTPLPRPAAHLRVEGLTVAPPGSRRAVVREVSFEIAPGEALGVIGPSASGKSTLARAVTGAWPPLAGRIALGGASLDRYDPGALGAYIGYLPQAVVLFDGTIAENIARMAPDPAPEAVIAAAQKAGAHDMIMALPQGYDTPLADGVGLSGGQRQLVGLARALHADPVLLVLDEPNANLDNPGNAALNAAIRGVKARGGAVMIVAHRPAAIAECDRLLVLEGGARVAFGPRDEVLRSQVRNVAQIRPNLNPVASP